MKIARNPVVAGKMLWHRYGPFAAKAPDAEFRRCIRWSFGDLERESFNAIFPSIERVEVRVVRSYDRDPRLSMTPSEVLAVATMVRGAQAGADPGDRHLRGQHDGQPLADRITQLWGDSAEFDWDEHGPFDFILIDGCHTYEYAVSDTRNALRVLRAGGVIVWRRSGHTGDLPNSSGRSLLRLLPGYIVNWLVHGAAFVCLSRGLGLDIGFGAGTTAFAAAYFMGYVVTVAPGESASGSLD